MAIGNDKVVIISINGIRILFIFELFHDMFFNLSI